MRRQAPTVARSEPASVGELAEVGGADRAEASEAVVRASLGLASRPHRQARSARSEPKASEAVVAAGSARSRPHK
jgi:hypothetical protein